MILNMLTIYALKKENNWFLEFLEGLKEDLMDILNDIGDIFISFKELVYDGLVEEFGAMPINLLLLGIIFTIIILVFLKLIN